MDWEISWNGSFAKVVGQSFLSLKAVYCGLWEADVSAHWAGHAMPHQIGKGDDLWLPQTKQWAVQD